MVRIGLLLLATSALFFQSRAQAVDALFLDAARKKLASAKEYTLQVAASMPSEYYQFQPAEYEMTFGGQLLHLSANLGWLSSTYLTSEQNPVQKADMRISQKDSVIAVVTRTYDYALQALDRFPPNQLNENVTFFAGPMNKLQIVNLINDHQTHHRGQLIVYLRLKKITPPDYVGW